VTALRQLNPEAKPGVNDEPPSSCTSWHEMMRHIVCKVETEVETDGRWIAEIPDLPGALAYGSTEKRP
jgi:hypothetical protein